MTASAGLLVECLPQALGNGQHACSRDNEGVSVLRRTGHVSRIDADVPFVRTMMK
jgi:hypothetical protein